jgi:nicotinate-nucleotide pyrophosphorylase (carboxylating)
MEIMRNKMKLNSIDKKLMNLALEEDLGKPYFDATIHSIMMNESFTPRKGKFVIVSKASEPIIMCGISLVTIMLKKFTHDFELTSNFQDGEPVPPNTVLLTIETDCMIMLMLERTMLNFLRHLCAIATLTKKFVTTVQHTKLKILDTRKTTPGMRHLEKYAVVCGGGINHRMGLYDAVMMKDNHIDILGGMEHALECLPKNIKKSYPVIVEVRNLEELKIVIRVGRDKVTRVLLDNMTPDLLRQCVTLCQGVFETEASGGIDLTNVAAMAATGVDYVSIGALTHSAGQVDLSMLFA